MPRLIPQDPRFTNESERVVWENLRDSLRPQDTLIANFRLTDTRKDHEADLVVVMPDVGVVVVEVKGSGVRVEDGHWTIMRSGKRKPIDPVDQVRSTRYAIRQYIESDHRWADSSRSRVRFAHAVVTPFVGLGLGLRQSSCRTSRF